MGRFDKDIPLLKDRSFVPDKEQFPLEIWRQAIRMAGENGQFQRKVFARVGLVEISLR